MQFASPLIWLLLAGVVVVGVPALMAVGWAANRFGAPRGRQRPPDRLRPQQKSNR